MTAGGVDPAVQAAPRTVLISADAVGGVWPYAIGLCRTLPETHFILAVMGSRPSASQRAQAAGLANVTLVESDYRLEWMAGGQADLLASRRWLAELAARQDADLVHINGFAHAMLETRCPTLTVAHSDVLSWFAAVECRPAPPEWKSYREQVTAGLAAASAIVAPTRAALADVAGHYDLPTGPREVIPNGIDLSAFAPLTKRRVVMAAGRVWDAAKNLAMLDTVAAQLAWPVEIAGDATHPEGGTIRLDHVRLLGRLDPAEMAHRLGEAAIFAAPARYEPFGLGILEAAASGCALVLGDIASLRETWDGAARFVLPQDARALTAALAELIEDENARRRLAASARERAGRFSIDRMAAGYRTLYAALAGRPARHHAA